MNSSSDTQNRPVRILMQSRLSSRRLPAKALLPLGGLPMVALCAKRAARTGRDVWVATSDDSADDFIVSALQAHGIRFFRGPQSDVLKRFFMATQDLPSNAIIVRMTADNPFPDGTLIDFLVKTFLEENRSYLRTHSESARPGLSAEIFSLELLRAAQASATSAYDREHVTPWIVRNHGYSLARPRTVEERYSHVRCTLDTFEDYVRLKWAFDQMQDPVGAPIEDLYRKLSKYPGEPVFWLPPQSHGNLALGTVQLGLDYGIANKSGKPTRELAESILLEAHKVGVTSFDTARGYGDAEAVVGSAFENRFYGDLKIITKLDPLNELSATEDLSAARVVSSVDDSIFQSLRELKVPYIDTLLLHRWEHHQAFDGLIWKRLLELREMGVIRKLGASVYCVADAVAAMCDRDIQHLQIPFNVLDHRWHSEEFQGAVRKRTDVVIHARSPFLQGLLVSEENSWPKLPGVNPSEWIAPLDRLTQEMKRKSRADLCLAYVRSQPWIANVVLGVETLEQLRENLKLFREPPLSAEEVARVNQTFGKASEILLDPSQWAKWRKEQT